MDNLADAEHVESVSNVIQWTVLGPSLWKLVPQMQFQLYAISVVLAVLLSLFILVAYQSTRKSSDAKGGRKASLITSKWIFTSFNYTVVFSLTSGFFPVSCKPSCGIP
ncbi:MAG: hypothetical protein P4M11_07745 [Candidatus Pacebacteria bacterium]|nr:hypothetical protein [Candidatus Paceibacterota bacterium]